MRFLSSYISTIVFGVFLIVRCTDIPKFESDPPGTPIKEEKTTRSSAAIPVVIPAKASNQPEYEYVPVLPREWPRKCFAQREASPDEVHSKESKLLRVTVLDFESQKTADNRGKERDETQRSPFGELPWENSSTYLLKGEKAKQRAELSLRLRWHLSDADLRSTPGIEVEMSYQLDSHLMLRNQRDWDHPAAAGLLLEMLQGHLFPQRLSLVEVLNQIPGRESSEALAKLVVFDVDPRVRGAALERLRDRPRMEWQHVLMKAFRHVWSPAADHAAEAIIAMNDGYFLPELVALLDTSDPSLPVKSKKHGEIPMRRELVRINHNSNCIVCHAVTKPMEAATSDPQRGGVDVTKLLERLKADPESVAFRVPSRDEPLPHFSSLDFHDETAKESTDLYIRLDITYLRQDFSATLPVDDSGKWPARQRFDFFTRLRPATAAEIETAKQPRQSFPQKEAVKLVLRTLTGKDGGDSSREWEQILLNLPRE